jgi:hypothetical protein
MAQKSPINSKCILFYCEDGRINKNGHVLIACPEILKYWTCIVVFDENTI